MDSAMLAQIPVEYQNIYESSWKTIRTSIKLGRLRDVYHFTLFTTSNAEILSKANEVVSNYNEAFKVNVAFGFILRDRLTDELKFFHPSNNTMMFETPRFVKTPSDYKTFIDDIDQQDAYEYARLNKPSTKWIVERIVCVRFDVYRINISTV